MAAVSQSQRKVAGSLSRPSSSQSSGIDIRAISVLAFFVASAVIVSGLIFVLSLSTTTTSPSTLLTASDSQIQHQEQHKEDSALNLRNSQHSKQQQHEQKETLVLTTKLGALRIVLRPDLSSESRDYVRAMVDSGHCPRCNLYRVEKPGILQGILANPKHAPEATVKGSCPAGYESVKNDCPAWDASCACHGPVMTRGMVGWAAGQTGPDFFISTEQREATWWGTQHTVWGKIQDDESFRLVEQIWKQPTHKDGGLTMLDDVLKFDITLELS